MLQEILRELREHNNRVIHKLGSLYKKSIENLEDMQPYLSATGVPTPLRTFMTTGLSSVALTEMVHQHCKSEIIYAIKK